MRKKGYESWGDVFRAALRRGEDHGYAAYLADQWEKQKDRQLTKEQERGNEKEGP